MEISFNELLQKDLRGKVIIFPTDTVYGIGALLTDKSAVEKIYAIKKREENKPLAVLCGNLEDLAGLARNYETFASLAEKHLPGALTLVVDKKNVVPDYVTRGLDTVGIRIPDHTGARRLLNAFGPMAVTSLNLSSEPAILKYEDALAFAEQVDYIVKGPNLNAVASTVYDVRNNKVLRQGSITIEN